MTETTTKKRPAPYSYRPPKGREEAFAQLVAESGLSVNAFLTEAVFGRSRHRPAELRLLAKILGEAAQIRAQLHEVQLSGQAGQGSALSIEAVHDRLIEIRAALFRLMGRKP